MKQGFRFINLLDQAVGSALSGSSDSAGLIDEANWALLLLITAATVQASIGFWRILHHSKASERALASSSAASAGCQ